VYKITYSDLYVVSYIAHSMKLLNLNVYCPEQKRIVLIITSFQRGS